VYEAFIAYGQVRLKPDTRGIVTGRRKADADGPRVYNSARSDR